MAFSEPSVIFPGSLEGEGSSFQAPCLLVRLPGKQSKRVTLARVCVCVCVCVCVRVSRCVSVSLPLTPIQTRRCPCRNQVTARVQLRWSQVDTVDRNRGSSLRQNGTWPRFSQNPCLRGETPEAFSVWLVD